MSKKKRRQKSYAEAFFKRTPREGKTRWQDKAWIKSSHSGYSDVSYEDTWGLDTRLAQIIANHLRAFLKAEKGPNGGYPYTFEQKYGQENGFKEWLNALRKMIFAFEEYYDRNTAAPDRDTEAPEMVYDVELGYERKADESPEKAAEVKARIKEGMQLFIDNFEDLWI